MKGLRVRGCGLRVRGLGFGGSRGQTARGTVSRDVDFVVEGVLVRPQKARDLHRWRAAASAGAEGVAVPVGTKGCSGFAVQGVLGLGFGVWSLGSRV